MSNDYSPAFEPTIPPIGGAETTADLVREVKKLRKALNRYNRNQEILLRLRAAQSLASGKRRRGSGYSPLSGSHDGVPLGLLEEYFPGWEGLTW